MVFNINTTASHSRSLLKNSGQHVRRKKIFICFVESKKSIKIYMFSLYVSFHATKLILELPPVG